MKKNLNLIISIIITTVLVCFCIGTYIFKSMDYSKEGFVSKADYFFEKGLFSDALRYYKKTISLGSTKDKVYINASVALLKIGNYKAVFPYLNKLTANKEFSSEVYYLMGYAKYLIAKDKNKSYDEAIKCFENSISADNKFKPSYVFLGRIYEELQQYEHARTQYRKALFANTDNSEEFYGYIAYTYFKELRFDDALKYYQKAVKTNKNYVSAYCSIAEIYTLKGQKDKAEKYYKMAININPDFLQPYYKIGNIYYSDKKYEEAIDWYLKTMAINPNNDVINYRTGMAYKRLNNIGESLKYLRKAAYCGSDEAVEELRTMLETF